MKNLTLSTERFSFVLTLSISLPLLSYSCLLSVISSKNLSFLLSFVDVVGGDSFATNTFPLASLLTALFV